MQGISLVAIVLYWLVTIFIVILWVRVIFDLATSLVRGFRPKGFFLVLADIAYRITDPPVRAIRKVIKPIRVGGAYLDLSVLVLFIACSVLSFILRVLAS